MHDFPLHDLPTAIYPADSPWQPLTCSSMDARLCAQQECFDEKLYVFAEPVDMLTKLKANDSTASKPEA